MKLKSIVNNLLDNKNFYYVMIALIAIHLIIYVMNRAYNNIGILTLSAIIGYSFTKNKTKILLFCLIATHIFISIRKMLGGIEGLENNTATNIKNSETIDKLKNTDAELGTVAEQMDVDPEKVKQKLKDEKQKKLDNINKIKDQNNPDMNETTQSTEEEEPVPESFTGGGKKSSIRLDHAATIETAYDDLQNILGNDGISKLTDDTKKLMNQQKQLFSTMEALTPAVKETMSMLEGMDLKSITGLSSSASDIQTRLKGLLGGNKVVASNEK